MIVVKEHSTAFVPAVVAHGTMLCLSVLKLMLLIAFVFHNDVPFNKVIVTPFNVCLFSMIIGLIGAYASQLGLLIPDSPPNYVNVFVVFSTVCLEFCYIKCICLRALPRVSDEFPKMVLPLRWILFVLPIILTVIVLLSAVYAAIQDSPTILPKLVLLSTNGLGILSGLLILFVDGVLLKSFLRFSGRTSVQGFQIDPKFAIIARYGHRSIMITLAAMGFYVAYIIFSDETLYFCVNFMFSCVVIALGSMKAELDHNQKAHAFCVN
ncbi:hypothetical protein HDU84_008086 [Entophlyctis sp. JEL0112]|nr:hypothetical protein HDU84_008086 [Entophlyctis sp. JEL0112]